jgi:probable addiction module antidote protein
MMKASRFDAAEYLDNQEMIAAYLSEALEPGDTEYIYDALHTIARAKGMIDVTREALSGNSRPEFDTVRKVIESFGLKLVAEPIEKQDIVTCHQPYTPPSSLRSALLRASRRMDRDSRPSFETPRKRRGSSG